MPATKVTQGSFHQGNEKFGDTAGKQCACCSLFSVAFTLIKSPGHWDCKDLDFILENGDCIYKELNTNIFLMFDELPRHFFLFESQAVHVVFKENKVGALNSQSVPGSILDRNVSSDSNGLLLLLDDKCLSILWTKRFYFLFDSHSKNEKGEINPEGYSILLKLSTLSVGSRSVFYTLY